MDLFSSRLPHNRPLKVGIFSPYIPLHAGGGERFILTMAEYLSQKHDVSLLVSPELTPAVLQKMSEKYESLFELSLGKVRWQPSQLAQRTGSAWQNWRASSAFDVFIYLTDGSLFLAGAKKNILHIQIPFQNTQHTLPARLKLMSWNVKNANSHFTKDIVENNWRTRIPYVHYPYVDTSNITFSPKKKEKKIIAVGRFFDPNHTDMNAKRQDVLVEAFRQGCIEHNWDTQGWELHLAGSVEPGSVHEIFVKKLQDFCQDLPVFFHLGTSAETLNNLYQKSSIFWHATGFGIDEQKEPQKVEHFGITPIEAMAHGCIPIVVGVGGITETIEDGIEGFHFSTAQELTDITTRVQNFTAAEKEIFQKRARQKSEQFSKERFQKTIDTMLFPEKAEITHHAL